MDGSAGVQLLCAFITQAYQWNAADLESSHLGRPYNWALLEPERLELSLGCTGNPWFVALKQNLGLGIVGPQKRSCETKIGSI